MSVTDYAYAHAEELRIEISRLEHMDKMLEKWAASQRPPSIAVRVLRYGKEIFCGAYGVAGPDKAIGSMRADMIFPVCSITKPITATMLCILQEDGEIDLCDPLNKYLPAFVGEGKESVLLWHLLTHCSGITDEGVRGFIDENGGKDMPYDKAYELGFKAPLTCKPKTEMTYCNTAYQYCADVIKNVTGKSLDEFAGERIFRPLGMENSFWVAPREKWDNIVRRSTEYNGGNWLNSENCFLNGSGYNGLKTTIFDICDFFEMIRNNGTYKGARILSPATVREMSTNHNQGMKSMFRGIEQGSSWGLGFNLRGDKKDDLGILRSAASLSHGGYGGVTAMTDPTYGVTFALFTVDVDGEKPYFPKFANMVYAALD